MAERLGEHDREAIVALYEGRFRTKGRCHETVGWSSSESQILRFEMLFRGFETVGKTILDVGCGLGDLVPFLDQRTGGDYDYVGIDLAPSLLADAESEHGTSRRRFVAGDVWDCGDIGEVDIVVMSGALNFRIEDNLGYAKAAIARMFELAREGVAANFLTDYVDYEVENNFYYSPEALFAHAKSLTRYVALLHDYRLWEFTLQLRKRAADSAEES